MPGVVAGALEGRSSVCVPVQPVALSIEPLKPSVSFAHAALRRVAIVAAGYADGIIRAAAGKGHAWAAGARRRILAVNMDLLVIDIGDAPLAAGDPVELLGPNAPLDDLATAAGTVAHEVLYRLSGRAERTYLGEA